MGAYNYKEVVYRGDFKEAIKEWEALNGPCDCNPGYDGDYWLVVEFLLNRKDEKIAKLEEVVKTRQEEI